MPKYNFMISKAVDLVARKLAGMDPDTVARVTQVLSEEAQMISDELQRSGQNVSSDIIAARLDGLVARMKYEVKNQEPDPSPHEFPIFNVSHNPVSPYPNPINHLYDKRYKEAYSTFIKQNQPAPSNTSNAQPSTPTTNTNVPPPATHSQGQHQQQPPSSPSYSQGQYQQQSNKQQPPLSSSQPPDIGWQYMNPYATMPRSHAAYYQQQASKVSQSTPEQPITNSSQPVHRSSTGENLYSQSLSRSASSNELNYSANSGPEKIRVRVINDNSGSSLNDPQINSTTVNNRSNFQRSLSKPSTNTDNTAEVIPVRKVYAPPGTDVGSETVRDLFQIVNNPRTDPSQPTSASTERVIIIDRRGPGTPDNNNPNSSGKERYREFEIRSTPPVAKPSTSSTSAATTATTTTTAAVTSTTSTPTNSTSSNAYVMQQPNFYAGQQMFYPQMRAYSSIPSSLNSAATPYVTRNNFFYPYVFYRY